MKIVTVIGCVLAVLMLLGILCLTIIAGEALKQSMNQEDNLAENEPITIPHDHFDPGGMYV
jgi:hypothetical protein